MTKPRKVMSYSASLNFLKEKFGETHDQVDYWLSKLPFYDCNGYQPYYEQDGRQYPLPYHDAEGKPCNQPVYNPVGNLYPSPNCDSEENPLDAPYYDEDTIKNSDFVSRFSLKMKKMILRSQIAGEIISGIEASAILNKKFENLSKFTINQMLGRISAYETKEANKNDEIAMTNCPNEEEGPIFCSDILRGHETRFYSENDVHKLMPEPQENYINFETLEKRKTWKDFKEQPLLNFLKQKNRDGNLRVFDPDYYFPGHMKTEQLSCFNNKGEQLTHERREAAYDFSGPDAEKLIDSKEALFCLAEIIAIEEECFKKEKSKEPTKSSTHEIVETLFEEELGKIIANQGKVPVSLNRGSMAKRILKEAQEKELFSKEITLETIKRILTELKCAPRLRELKIQNKKQK